MKQFWSAREIVVACRVRFCIATILTLAVMTAAQFAWAEDRLNPDAPAVRLQPVVSGLAAPLDLQSAHDGTSRLFIVEQGGTIRIFKGTKLLGAPFLNISSIIVSGGETGLLGLAFHPQYKTNGRFFVNYTRLVNGNLQTVIAEYHVSSSSRDLADPNSGKILLTIAQPFDNHKGGQLAFGPEGFLYIGTGDGGSGGDPLGNGQKLSTLLGKMLRIDINSGSPYGIPPDNPFVGVSGAKGEIYAYGFRNPWRFAFDNKKSKRLFVADVGQDVWEEVDIVTKGGNFGWNIMEGNHCYPPGANCDISGKVSPIAEYSHSEGIAVIGGYVYRGKAIPALLGLYVFGDFGSGKMWTLQETQPVPGNELHCFPRESTSVLLDAPATTNSTCSIMVARCTNWSQPRQVGSLYTVVLSGEMAVGVPAVTSCTKSRRRSTPSRLVRTRTRRAGMLLGSIRRIRPRST